MDIRFGDKAAAQLAGQHRVRQGGTSGKGTSGPRRPGHRFRSKSNKVRCQNCNREVRDKNLVCQKCGPARP